MLGKWCKEPYQLCAPVLHVPSQKPVLVVNVLLDCLGGHFLALHGMM